MLCKNHLQTKEKIFVVSGHPWILCHCPARPDNPD